MIDHDRLFKELLSTFFIEFLDLFFPEMLTYLQPASITFLDKEVFTDVTAGDRYETDLLVQLQFQGQPSFFLVHIENQATPQPNFGKRMFRYFSRLYEKYDYPIYPIVIFSYDQPQTLATEEFKVEFPDFAVLRFSYRVIQLNQLNWRDFLSQSNPVASALMAKMRIAPEDRPKVKAECLRLLVTLKLNPARTQLISGFVDTYLKLTAEEEAAFNLEVGRIEPEVQDQVMEIVTSWMEKGIERGLEQGRLEGRRQEGMALIQKQLTRRVGSLPESIQSQVKTLSLAWLEQLGEALLDFTCLRDLELWLAQRSQQTSQTIQLLREKIGELPPEVTVEIQSLAPEQLEQLLATSIRFSSLDDLQSWLRAVSDEVEKP